MAMAAERLDLLVIEDNPNDAELMRHALARVSMDLKVAYISDGAEALDYLVKKVGRGRALPPKLVVLDLKLPRIDGHEILRRAKHHPYLRSVPFVVLTSSQQESDILSCYQEGANSYLVKPVDFSRFAQSIQMLGSYWLTLNQAPI